MSNTGLLCLLICRGMYEANLRNSVLKVEWPKVRIMENGLYILRLQFIETPLCLNCNTCIFGTKNLYQKGFPLTCSFLLQLPKVKYREQNAIESNDIALGLESRKNKGALHLWDFPLFGD